MLTIQPFCLLFALHFSIDVSLASLSLRAATDQLENPFFHIFRHAFLVLGNEEEGETEVVLSKVSDNFVKFNVAQPSGESIQSISFVNAEDIVLIIKSGNVEQRISHDPSFPDIDAAEGEILFKVTKDVATRFDQKDTNLLEDKFYINIKNGTTESLLYYGKVKIV